MESRALSDMDTGMYGGKLGESAGSIPRPERGSIFDTFSGIYF